MAKKQPIVLQPGFLGLREKKGVMLLASPERQIILQAVLMTHRVISGTFGIASALVPLRESKEQPCEHVEKVIEEWAKFFQENGTRLEVAIYVNAQDHDTETIRFTESLAMQTINLRLDDNVLDREDIARQAIINILKAI